MGELAALVGTRHGTVIVDDRRHDGLVGALTRLTNAVDALPRRCRARSGPKPKTSRVQLEQTRGAGQEAFAHADELRGARRRAEALRRELAERYEAERAPFPARALDAAPNDRQLAPSDATGAGAALRSALSTAHLRRSHANPPEQAAEGLEYEEALEVRYGDLDWQPGEDESMHLRGETVGPPTPIRQQAEPNLE